MTIQTDPLGDPLTWKEARSRLRRILENYVKDPPPPRRARDRDVDLSNESILTKWIDRDFDLYFGALFFSLALFILSCFSLSAKLGGLAESELHPSASDSLYKSQVVASLLLVLGACASLWMVRRRSFLSLNDTEYSKRREIFRFLRALTKHEDNGRNDSSDCQRAHKIHLTGNSLGDIYPVYRRARESNDEGCWSRIPRLLLVRGDHIALQVGDEAPCDCVMMNRDKLTSTRLAKDDRLSLELIQQTPDQIMRDLPKGRTTLAPSSEHLLTLCNRLRVFLVVRAPIQEFIYRPSATSHPSQASRRVSAARKSLAMLSLFLLVVTGSILFSRSASSEDFSLLLPIPLLAAIGVLPIVGPAFFFFLEALGTARILVTVHPFSSSTVEEGENRESASQSRLLLRYMSATVLSRLSLWDLAQKIHRMLGGVCPGLCLSRDHPKGSKLVRVPPASLNLLEKLGVATAFTLVDDELACEQHAIPQQLLIPTGKGLNLLDLCPTYDDASDVGSDPDSVRHGRSFDSDSESEDSQDSPHHGILRRKIMRRRRKIRQTKHEDVSDANTVATTDSLFEVQFEEPTWWQYLPSLKCIGLACLLLDKNRSDGETAERDDERRDLSITKETSLVQSICRERQSKQLRSLAHCIGFSTSANANGFNGDITAFKERIRFHILSTSFIRQRLLRDVHERSSEWTRWWGLLRPDSTSVVVKDSRTNAFQLLTIGDPSVVVDLCQEAWQGESSTILPLGAVDRQTIVETTNNWKLGDLDVSAFSYSPVPRSLEPMLNLDSKRQVYILDHNSRGLPNNPLHRDKTMSAEWSFMKNQIFLGVLGSLVVPRREIQNLLPTLNDAGVRFVYFSPRNMRRQKELASQMGIDVAWNCAISLRSLESGEEDPHRMVSNYADWDVNAKLPHGVDDVRKHLEEVDNVPLLVSLYTDVTKETTAEMVEIFQDYSDTVISVGLSHLTSNDKIFSVADIAVGIDTLCCNDTSSTNGGVSSGHVLTTELEFVSSIAARSCAFRFRGDSSVAHIATVIEQSRTALEAAVAASSFVLFGFLSYSFFVLFSVCVPSTFLPYIPVLGTVLFLQGVLPALGFVMALSNGDTDIMKRVPPKNDQSVTFARKEGWKLYTIVILKAIPPALLPQVLHLIVFGELLLHFEPDLAADSCPGAASWVDIVRCKDLQDYSGPAKISSGVLVIAEMALCVVVASMGFLSRMETLFEHPPWKRNIAWVICLLACIAFIVLYGVNAVDLDIREALPWYCYLLVVILPILCLVWVETCKKSEARFESRAEKLRRLQFETRLGAWSPK